MPTQCQRVNTAISFTYARGGPVIQGDVKLSNFSLTLGLGASSSNLDLELVYNNCAGAGGVSLPSIGRAVRFNCGQLSFGGIINSRSYSETSGGASYKFKIIDPRKILENVSVMLKDYYCPLSTPNFINAAYLVERGVGVCPPGTDTHNWPRVGDCGNFGKSGGANGAYLAEVLRAIQSNNSPVFTTIGERLSLNLSSVIAVCPRYATTDGSSASLLSLISQACDEGACDFFVTLQGSTIVVSVINRAIQPQLGLIEQIVRAAQSTGTLISGEVGEEELYETSNKVVIGEKGSYMTTVQTRNKASMMLGFDLNGDPIRVTRPNFSVNINVSSLSESMRALAGISLPNMFNIREEEILCGGSVELWKLYGTIRPNSLSGYLQKQLGINQKMKQVFEAFSRLQQANNDQASSDFNTVNRSPRFAAKEPKVVLYEQAYQWFNSWITDWYGKKWLIPINKICVSPIPTGGVVSEGGSYYLSDAPTDAGWPNEANLLGLTYGVDTTIFESSDNRLSGFLVLPTSESMPRQIYGKQIDFVLSPDGLNGDYLIKNNRVYVKISTDGELYRKSGSQTESEVLITSPFMGLTPKLDQNLVSFGLTALACLMDEKTLKGMEQREKGYTDITSCNIYKMGSASAGFDIATIPMKSNVYVYGPWTGSKGPIGSTEILQTNLSPWNYGNEEIMNSVGQALANNGLRVSNRTESGSMTLAEPPGYSIETFISAGVVINSINVNYNSGGATTSYNFQTYSAKFGQYGKALADNVQRAIKARNEIFTFAKEQRRRTISLTNTIRSSFSRATSINSFRGDTRSSLNSSSPNNVLVGGYHNKNAIKKVVEIGLNSKKEYETSIEGSNFQNIVAMSLDGLFMPVSIRGRGDSLPRYMSNFKYQKGDTSRKTRPSMPPLNDDQKDPQKAFPINQTYLNPILSSSMLSEWEDGRGRSSSTTIQVLSFGTNQGSEDIYGPIETKYNNQDDFGFYSLRGPLVLQAWGYDTENKPIPNIVDNPEQAKRGEFKHERLQNRFLNDWLSKPETWPVGPVDLRFDRDRGVWVCPPPDRVLLAKLEGELSATGCAKAKLVNSTISNASCEQGPAQFHEDYTVWGPNGEPIMPNIEKQKITVYNFLDEVTIPSGELVYVIYNDDKYIAIPKGGGSKIKVCKYDGEWKKNEAKTVSPYKVSESEKDHKTDPSVGSLEGDPEYEPVKALNLLHSVKPKDGSETWCVIADIGSSFHVVVAFGGSCENGMDAGIIDPEADEDSDPKDITQGDNVQILINENGCAKWWKVQKMDVVTKASLEASTLKFDKKTIFVLISGEDIDPDTIDTTECEEEEDLPSPSGTVDAPPPSGAV
jgi:hypothetical protein